MAQAETRSLEKLVRSAGSVPVTNYFPMLGKVDSLQETGPDGKPNAAHLERAGKDTSWDASGVVLNEIR